MPETHPPRYAESRVGGDRPTPCNDAAFDHRRKSTALGITFDVPVCRCGADLADHELPDE